MPGDLVFRTYSQFDPGGPWLEPVQNAGTAAAGIFANRKAVPRVWMVHAAEVLPDAQARLARLYDPAFDWTRTVALAVPLGKPLVAAPPGADSVEVTGYAAEAVNLTAASPAAGILVLADQAFPGWEANVDGMPAPILTVDHALRGVYLPAGSHRVGFTYRPASVAWGAGVSALALLAILGLALRPRRRPAVP